MTGNVIMIDECTEPEDETAYNVTLVSVAVGSSFLTVS